MALISAFGKQATTELFLDESAIELSDDFGFRGVKRDLGHMTMTLREIAIAITAIGPRDKLPTSRFFSAPASGALMNLRAFIFRPHPLPLSY